MTRALMPMSKPNARICSGISARAAMQSDPRQRDADDHAGERHGEGLDQQAAHDRAAAGAQRDADGDVALTLGRAREPHVGEVHARDEQDDGRGGEQEQTRRPLLPRQRAVERKRDQPPVAILLHRAGVVARGARGERRRAARSPVRATCPARAGR